MKTALRLSAKLWRVQALAECAVWDTRPDLQHLCKTVPKQGVMSVELIRSELPGLSDAGYANLFRHLQYLRLIGDDGRLTRMGTHCATSGSAPTWEMGVYDLLVAQHPLIGSPILSFRRVGSGPGARFGELVRVPEWLKPDPEHVATSVFDSSLRFSIHRFPQRQDGEPSCQCAELAPATLSLQIDDLATGRNSWQLAGTADAFDGAFQSALQSLPPQHFAGLIAAWDPRWNNAKGYVAIAYDGVADSGRDDFRRVITYKNKVVAGFTLPEVVVKDVPVGPATPDDARRWTLALITGSLMEADAYVTADRFARTWDEIVAPTELGTVVQPIAMADVVSDPGFGSTARMRWLMSAAVDLGSATP